MLRILRIASAPGKCSFLREALLRVRKRLGALGAVLKMRPSMQAG